MAALDYQLGLLGGVPQGCRPGPARFGIYLDRWSVRILVDHGFSENAASGNLRGKYFPTIDRIALITSREFPKKLTFTRTVQGNVPRVPETAEEAEAEAIEENSDIAPHECTCSFLP
ncbi:hypothetical protein MTP99_008903 [Tenebrio molitor]|jgi:hypothetical protein|nr:hypothetical protein MTP99_008903 [Tenebrio molitor]